MSTARIISHLFFQLNGIKPFGLSQVIKEPTRVTATTSTLIDHILVNNPDNVKTCGVVDVPGISDHHLVYMAYAIKKPKFTPKTFTRREGRGLIMKGCVVATRDIQLMVVRHSGHHIEGIHASRRYIAEATHFLTV